MSLAVFWIRLTTNVMSFYLWGKINSEKIKHKIINVWRKRQKDGEGGGGSQVERRKLFNVNSVDSAIVLFYRMQIETSLLSTNSQLWDLK